MKSFKELISEASLQRAGRIKTALDNLEDRMTSRVVGFDEDNPFHMVDLQSELADENDPDALKQPGLQQAHIDAESKDYMRRQFIATRLKDKNPELYHKYRNDVRPIVMGNIERKINSISRRIQTLRNLRAPEQLIQQEHKRLEDVHTHAESQMADHIARAHRDAMEQQMRPQ